MTATSTSSEMGDLVSATASEAVDAVRDQYANVISAIRRNPLQSAGIAAGAGFVLALLLKR
jgi:ElaB/YqjD/DUF883 family membrane-anchored ribosome-binding protein